jgi:dipeptidyl-peptidase-4
MSELGLRAVKVAPDGSRVTWLAAGEDGPRVLDLWELDARTRKSRLLLRSRQLVEAEHLTDEEKARRERLRLSDVGGIVEYAWSPGWDALLFPLGGHLYYWRPGAGDAPRRLTSEEGEVTDARFSPKGRFACFVRARHLWAIDVATGQQQRLSDDIGTAELAGVAEFIAQEEMHRFTGYWWAPDESFVAYTVVDEAEVALVKRLEVYADRFETVEQRYPYAGSPNAAVRLIVKAPGAGSGLIVSLRGYEYLARVDWDATGKRLLVQTQDRSQKRLTVSAAYPHTGDTEPLFVEEDRAWVNLHDDLRPIGAGRFLWASEATGYKHLVLCEADGRVSRKLTSGDWAVSSVRGVDREAGIVYFDAFKDSPVELHLYAVSWLEEGAGIRKLTGEPGWHETTMSSSGKLWVDVFSAPATPPRVRVHDGEGALVAELGAPVKAAAKATTKKTASVPSEIGSIKGPDGSELFYRLRLPPKRRAGKRYPAVVHVYGGPGFQMVQRRWQPRFDALESRLAQAGFVVFALDNRGSSHRGKRFESVLRGGFGRAEVEDQAAGARFLQSLDCVDGERIGIFGASYGGFMTLQALLKEPELFKVGVSIAPVTDWKVYDTHYTERYLGHPDEDPAAYERSAVLPLASRLSGQLLLVHGMADDNVLFTHSTKLYKALQDAGKMFDIMCYPGEKHGITGPAARRHEEEAIVRYFQDRLRPLRS